MTSRRLIINWRDPHSRRILPVAELVASGEPASPGYEFGYVEGVRRALELGFQPFLAFPRLDRRYSGTELFPFFRNRILSSTRPDYTDYVEALGLEVQTATEVELLGRSEGRRRTDRVETVLAGERDPATGRYVVRFPVRGVRHVPGAEAVIAGLRPEQTLASAIEATNPYNRGARRLYRGDEPIGYVADYLLDDLDALEAAASRPTFTVERINPPPHPVHHRVLVRLEADWPEGFESLDAPSFRPYRESDEPSLRSLGS
ncbi:MAG: hypothetical protein AB1Z98_02185 [Nannocystaceae bacterium]